MYLVYILNLICNLQSAVCSLHFLLTESRSIHFRTSNEQKKSRCLCVSNERLYTHKCRSLNCMNRMSPNELKADRECRRGEFFRSKTDKSRTKTCADILGARRTKCACYANKQACPPKCCCHNCGNEYGMRESQASV